MNKQITSVQAPEVKKSRGKKLSITAIVLGGIAMTFCLSVPIEQIYYGILTGFFGRIFLAAIEPIALFITLLGVPVGVVGMVLGSRGTKLLREEGRKVVLGRIGFFVALAGVVYCALLFTCYGFMYLQIYLNFFE